MRAWVRQRFCCHAGLQLALATLVVLAVVAVPCAAAARTDAAGNHSAPAFHVYFGDLHNHTSFSDGAGTPDQAWAQARASGADFLAVTDHRNRLSDSEWAEILAGADASTSAGFVAISGFELGAGIGHLNVYGTSSFPDLSLDGPALYDWIAGQSAIAQWNHPLRASQNFDDFASWSPTRDAAIDLLEVVNHSASGTNPGYESSYVLALDKGWHVMPSANKDTHDTTWIIGNGLRTALLAPELTRQALYDAIRARRGYATTDQDLIVGFSVAGAVMGSVTAQTAGACPVSVHVEDPDAASGEVIAKVEIVTTGGTVVAAQTGSGRILDWATTVDSVAGRYYYVRVWERSTPIDSPKKTAWTAPVWLVDQTAPHTLQYGVDDAWHRTPVTVTLDAADNSGGSGVARTEYRLDGGPLTNGSGVVVDGDGAHVLEYRSVDHAGNVEAFNRVVVRVDTSLPVPLAPVAARVRRGSSVGLIYRVDDATPGGGRVTVVILVRDSSGAVVKILRRGAQPVGVRLTARFWCALAPGHYRFAVYATDAAGNAQLKPALNVLRVTR